MKDIAVIGLGVFGHEIAIQLEKKGNHILAADLNPTEVDRIKDYVTGAVVADVTDEEALRELDIAEFDLVILGIGSHFEQLVLGVTHLKRLNVKYIIARASTEIQQEILLKIGVDEVVLPEKQAAIHLSEKIAMPNILECIALDENEELAEICIDKQLAGKSLKDLNLRQKYNVTALLLKREGNRSHVINSPEEKFIENDQVVVVGKKADIQKIFTK
ncbi:MAG: trk system potassium uptake protein TrkA [Desulforhopalus sp.]|jgi:trk system potassium uptake protein TrkA